MSSYMLFLRRPFVLPADAVQWILGQAHAVGISAAVWTDAEGPKGVDLGVTFGHPQFGHHPTVIGLSGLAFGLAQNYHFEIFDPQLGRLVTAALDMPAIAQAFSAASHFAGASLPPHYGGGRSTIGSRLAIAMVVVLALGLLSLRFLRHCH